MKYLVDLRFLNDKVIGQVEVEALSAVEAGLVAQREAEPAPTRVLAVGLKEEA